MELKLASNAKLQEGRLSGVNVRDYTETPTAPTPVVPMTIETVLRKLTAIEDKLEELADVGREQAEKLHDIERDLVYALTEKE